MHITYSQQISLPLLRHTVLVMGLCFLPFLTSSPWWLSILACLAIAYRLFAGYRHYSLLPLWLRALLIIVFLALLRWHYESFLNSGFFIGCLITFFWLKVVEIHKQRDIRVIVICSFYVIFTAIITNPNLWTLLYIILASSAIVSLLLKLEAPNLELKEWGLITLKFMTIAIPISLVLFFIFPRMNVPLWNINLPQQGAIGFNESLNPGSLANLMLDESTVMRVTPRKPLHTKLYWHGLALSYYNGASWSPYPHAEHFIPLPELYENEPADFEIILEPHAKNWLFYTAFPVAAWPHLQISAAGLKRLDGKEIRHRFAYSYNVGNPQNQILSLHARVQNLQLPVYSSPKLKAWAIEQRSHAKSDSEFVNNTLRYITREPFWYRLSPAPIGLGPEQLDRFWFDTREGYCEHYASAFAFILRSAKIPSRVILGYFGGEWNPIAQYLTVKQKDAHAWVEYWEEGKGWRRVDPTRAVAAQRIDPTIREQNTRTLAFYNDWENYRFYVSWLEKTQLSVASIRFFWERWLLFYNKERQNLFLETLGFDSLSWIALFGAWAAAVAVFVAMIAAWYQWKRHRETDPLLREYHRVQKEMNRLNVHTSPRLSLAAQWEKLASEYPNLRNLLNDFLIRYEELRLKPAREDSTTRKSTQLLFRSLRKILKKITKPL
jgi:transglutaminase-like putative cysteine protease